MAKPYLRTIGVAGKRLKQLPILFRAGRQTVFGRVSGKSGLGAREGLRCSPWDWSVEVQLVFQAVEVIMHQGKGGLGVTGLHGIDDRRVFFPGTVLATRRFIAGDDQ